MKKIFTILFVCFAFQSMAQGNLQFNQVLTFNGTINNSQPLGATYSVPANKVWKIKHLTEMPLFYISSNGYFNLYHGLMVNVNGSWFQSPSTLKETFLKTGDTIKIGYYNQDTKSNQFSNVNFSFDYLISIVEFNIIP
jgi:hypothetical protein